MSEELKPCPFCGIEPAFYETPDPENHTWNIECLADECNGGYITGPDKDQVLRRWNTRPAVSKNAELEKEIEEEIRNRDYWEGKATELAEDVGRFIGVDVGEHSSHNCPVESAINALAALQTSTDRVIVEKRIVTNLAQELRRINEIPAAAIQFNILGYAEKLEQALQEQSDNG